MPPKKRKGQLDKIKEARQKGSALAAKRKREGDARTYSLTQLTQLTQLAQLAQPTRSIVVRWHFFCIACIELFA